MAPTSFRRPHTLKRVYHTGFHLLLDVDLPAQSFLFQSKPHTVLAVYQIWRRQEPVCPPHPISDPQTWKSPEFEVFWDSELKKKQIPIDQVIRIRNHASFDVVGTINNHHKSNKCLFVRAPEPQEFCHRLTARQHLCRAMA